MSFILNFSVDVRAVELHPKVPYYKFNDTYSYLIEIKDSSIDIDDILKLNQENYFEQHRLQLGYNRNIHSVYWKKIVLTTDSLAYNGILEFPDPHIGSVNFYKYKNGQLTCLAKTGHDLPFSTRLLEHKNFTFPMYLGAHDTVVYFAKLNSRNFFSTNAVMRRVDDYSNYFLVEYYLLGFYYGIIFILFIYNLFLGISLKEKVYFSYCTYLITCMLYTYSEDGLGFQWHWGDYPGFNVILSTFNQFFLLIAFLVYANHFIEWKKHYPKLIYVFATIAVLYLISIPFKNDYFFITGNLYLIPFFITYFASIQLYRKGFRPARFFIVGNTTILISFLVFNFRVHGWIGPSVYSVYIFNFGFIIEAVVLSIALSDKFKNTKEQKEQAQQKTIHQLQINEELQQKINKELDDKVKERTQELSKKTSELTEANTKLKALQDELYQMNSVMDKNIWELSKSIKQEKVERALKKQMNADSFTEVFNESKCLEIVISKKWPNGFCCAKCDNTKFSKKGNTYKCTKCKHTESVTASTLFHGIRFPISKAFYLVYSHFQEGEKSSIEQLAQELNVGKNTVWKFINKIKSKHQEKKEQNSPVQNWQDLIF